MEIKRHLRDFIGMHTWEELCREWTLRAAVRGDIPLTVDQVGSIWTKTAQVDVVGVNRMEKHLVLGECKWSLGKIGRKALRTLIEKTAEVVPKQGQWHIHYLGFARDGWTKASQTMADNPAQLTKASHTNWQISGIQLLTLPQIDRDLQQWS